MFQSKSAEIRRSSIESGRIIIIEPDQLDIYDQTPAPETRSVLFNEPVEERDYWPCDLCSCIMEDACKLSAHMQRYHKEGRNNADLTPPISDNEIVTTPKSRRGSDWYERNSTMCEKVTKVFMRLTDNFLYFFKNPIIIIIVQGEHLVSLINFSDLDQAEKSKEDAVNVDQLRSIILREKKLSKNNKAFGQKEIELLRNEPDSHRVIFRFIFKDCFKANR